MFRDIHKKDVRKEGTTSNPEHFNMRGVYECNHCTEEFWLCRKGDERALKDFNEHRKDEHNLEPYNPAKPRK